MGQAKRLPEKNKKYRLITRSDMDGLVCGILLKEMDMVSEILFVHPKDMQDGKVDVCANDITTNLPYHKNAFLSFDHHTSEIERVGGKAENHVIDGKAKSAARVVYDYFGGKDRFPNVSDAMMAAVDKADSAGFTREDIMDPKGWELLSFIMDSRTGLGRFRDFNISNYQLMMQLIDYCRTHQDINDILALPDVKERVDLYKDHKTRAQEQVERCSKLYKNLIVLDLRNEQSIWAANRFLIYALFPQCNVSIHAIWGKNNQNTVFAVGKSILNKTSRTDIGSLMLQYGGGGHMAAGTCQVDNLSADDVLQELIDQITTDG